MMTQPATKFGLKTNGLALGAAVTALGFAAATAGADVIALQQGVDSYAGTRDTVLHHSSPNENGGGQDILQTRGPSGSNREETTLISFDLAGVAPPAGQTLQSATLTLTKYASTATRGTTDTQADVDIFRMKRPWVEGDSSLGDANPPSGATWEVPDAADPSVTWNTPGARGSGTDRAATASDTTTVTIGDNGAGDGPYDWDVTNDVQAFLNGSETNNGWVLDTTKLNLGAYYRASEAVPPGRGALTDHPKLTLNFAPASVPEPATLGLMSAGAVLFLRRRRRQSPERG